MPREPLAYRDNLEDLLQFFGGRRMLNLKDVARYTGRDYRWCKDRFAIATKKGISAPTRARMLADRVPLTQKKP